MAVGYPIFPDVAPGRSYTLPTAAGGRRINIGGQGWNVKKSATWSEGRQQSVSGRTVVTQYWKNPLWKWEFVYGEESGYLSDNPASVNVTIIPSNAPYTDLDILSGFYNAMQGGGQEFVYQPPDSAVVGQALLDADATNHTELVHQIGGIPSSGSMVQVNESVQVIDPSTLVVYENGTPSPSYAVLGADTISPYQGIVILFASAPTPPITADFNYYYLCRFSEDSQDYENFQAMLWSCNSVKIEQVRI